MDLSRVISDHRQFLFSKRRVGYRGCQKMLAGSEIFLDFSTVSGDRVVRHGTTAFLTFVGGRAFQEAVGIFVYEWKASLTGLEDHVKKYHGRLRWPASRDRQS